VLAVVLATAAAVWLAVWPCVYRNVFSEFVDGVRTITTSCDSLLDANGVPILAVLAIPVGLSAFALWAVRVRSSRGLWGAVILMLAFCLLTGLSVGLWFLPAAIAIMLAALAPPQAEAD
jgi:hypothetical protein